MLNVLWIAVRLGDALRHAFQAPAAVASRCLHPSFIPCPPQHLVLAGVGGACKLFLTAGARTAIEGQERMAAALNREAGRGLITVSNHVGAVDDPLITSSSESFAAAGCWFHWLVSPVFWSLGSRLAAAEARSLAAHRHRLASAACSLLQLCRPTSCWSRGRCAGRCAPPTAASSRSCWRPFSAPQRWEGCTAAVLAACRLPACAHDLAALPAACCCLSGS